TGRPVRTRRMAPTTCGSPGPGCSSSPLSIGDQSGHVDSSASAANAASGEPGVQRVTSIWWVFILGPPTPDALVCTTRYIRDHVYHVEHMKTTTATTTSPRERLLVAASAHVAAHGFHDLSLRELAA